MRKKVLVCLLMVLVVGGISLGPLPQIIGNKAQAQETGHEPMLALLLGLIIPGGAQFYNGDIKQGITYLVAVVAIGCIGVLISTLLWELWFHGLGIFGTLIYLVFDALAAIIWLYAMWTGYQKAILIKEGKARKGTGFRYDGFDLKPAYALR